MNEKQPKSRATTWMTLLLTLALMGAVALPAVARDDDEHDERPNRETHEREHEEEEEEEDHEDWDDDDWEDEFFQEIELYEGILNLVERMTEISSNADTAAVAAVMGVDEHIEDEQQAAKFLENTLAQCTDDDVVAARAIRIKLAELYGEMDEPEKALNQLRMLILNKPLEE